MKHAKIQWAVRASIALAVIMAVGCGDSPDKSGKRTHIKRSLITKLANQKPGANAQNGTGNINYTSQNGGASMTQTTADHVDQAFSAVASAGSQLNGMSDLQDGTYTLKGVTTRYKSNDTSTNNQNTDTMSTSAMTSTSNSTQLSQTSSLNNNIKLAGQDVGRQLIAPYTFSKQGEAVTALQSLALTSKVGTDSRITDQVNDATNVNALSLLDITKGSLQSMGSNQNDFGYKAVDKNVPVYVRVSRVSDSEVRFVIEFDEIGFSADGKPTNQQKTVSRSIVLSYSLAKAQSLEDAAKDAAKTQLDNNGAIVDQKDQTQTANVQKDDASSAADDAAAASDLGLPPAGSDKLPSP